MAPESSPPPAHDRATEADFRIPAWLYLTVLFGAAGLLTLLPRQWSGWGLLGLVGLVALVVAGRYVLPRNLQMKAIGGTDQARGATGKGLRAVPVWLVLVEITLIVAMAMAPTTRFWVPDDTTQFGLKEAQWLTSSARVAADTWHRYGYLPAWNPYNERGEPLVDNPFSFVMNPISALPTILSGNAEDGIKLSVALYAVLAATGGWFLARMLNAGTFGRLLLAALLLGKGNMIAMLTLGYFQLGVAQAYMPWIVGAAVGVVRLPRARWTVVLLAVSYTFLWWAGNIWYTLPMLLSVIGIWLGWDYRYVANQTRALALRRFALAGALTVGLSAITLFPIFMARDYIGGHRPLVDGGINYPILLVLQTFVEQDTRIFRLSPELEEFRREFYYSFAVNRWFLLLIFVLIPPIFPRGGQTAVPGRRRVYLIGLAFFVLFVWWGAGGLQPFKWLYNNVPGIGRWRFVGRALAGASFWLAVLVAIRADGIFRYWMDTGQAGPLRHVQRAAAVLLLAVGGMAGYQTAQTWDMWSGLNAREIPIETCAVWLREREGDGPLVVYRRDYDEVAAMYRHQIRVMPIEADYEALPLPESISTEARPRRILPPFAFPKQEDDTYFLLRRGSYIRIVDSPEVERQRNCAMRDAGALPFAFQASLTTVGLSDNLAEEALIELEPSVYTPGIVEIITAPLPAETSVLVVQENSYPGWHVSIDGQRTELETVMGFVAVRISRGNPADTVRVRFVYRPRTLTAGGVVTILTAVFAMGLVVRKPQT